MKISKWILLVSLFGSYAQAQMLPIFEKQRANVILYKNTIVRASNDTFYHVKTDLCQVAHDFYVFDYRNAPGKTFAPPTVTCEFEHDGQKHKINIELFVGIDRTTFGGTLPASDVKVYIASLIPQPWNTNPSLPIPDSITPISTKDLQSKGLILEFKPRQMILCIEEGDTVVTPIPNPNVVGPQTVTKLSNKEDSSCNVLNPVALGAVVEFETIP